MLVKLMSGAKACRSRWHTPLQTCSPPKNGRGATPLGEHGVDGGLIGAFAMTVNNGGTIIHHALQLHGV